MIVENLSIGEFFACIFILPFFIWYALVLFDGLGIFKDAFYISKRKNRRKK